MEFSQSSTDSPPRRGIASRVLGTLGICSVVVASLLTFPSGLPGMTAVWLLWSTRRIVRERPTWLLLLGCVAVVLVKRVTLTPALLLLVLTMVATAILDMVWTRGERWTRQRRWIAISTLACAWLYMVLDWQTTVHRRGRTKLDAQRPVACLGDSLTSGVAPYGGYPDKLQDLLSVPVVNFGREGITSSDALKDLPAILDANPQAVVIELGGHDFLKGHSRSSTKANLEKLIQASRDIGAEVILFEVPRGFITDPFAGIEREIAREHDVELLSDGAVRQLVLWSPIAPPGMWTGRGLHLSDDGLHPNGKGNAHLAQCVASSLQRVFGPEIRAGGK